MTIAHVVIFAFGYAWRSHVEAILGEAVPGIARLGDDGLEQQ